MKNKRVVLTKPCKCGCGETVELNRRGIRRGIKYIYGHANRDPEYLAKVGKGVKRVWKDPKYRKKIVKARRKMWQDPQYIAKQESINSDPEYLGRLSKSIKRACNTPEYQSHISKVRLRLWKDPKYQNTLRKARSLKPNKAELRLYNILQEIIPGDYEYVGDFKFFVGGKNPDFKNINGQKKLIELFGDYWHSRKFSKKQSEKERVKHFKKYGYKTLIVWEHELKDEESLRNKLYEFDY
jgi:hypothetical protein